MLQNQSITFNIQEMNVIPTTTITQLWFENIHTVQFSQLEAVKFWDTTQKYIVAVWHIKPKH